MAYDEKEWVHTISIHDCCTCGGPIALTLDQQRSLRKSHKSFYCPMGHEQHFAGKSNEERLKEQLEAANARAEANMARARAAEDATQRAEYRERAQKAAKTRIKNRVGKGVCPCCNRSFADLARHMASKHPGFASEEA